MILGPETKIEIFQENDNHTMNEDSINYVESELDLSDTPGSPTRSSSVQSTNLISATRRSSTGTSLVQNVNVIPPRRGYTNANKRQREVDSMLAKIGQKLCEERIDDDHNVFGLNVANKLRTLPNDQRIYLEKVISEAICEAELGNLSKASCISTPTPAPRHAYATSYVTPKDTIVEYVQHFSP